MKRALITIACGEYFERMAAITHPWMQAYANRIGAEFVVWRDFRGHTIPQYKKLDLAQALDDYDRVLFLDTDILVRDDAPNIFDLVPTDELGMLEEGSYFSDQVRPGGMLDTLRVLGQDFMQWNGKYYNTGVMVLSREHRSIFAQPAVERNHYAEQTYLNAMICMQRTKMCELPRRFNRMCPVDWIFGEERYDAYFIHYAGNVVMMTPERLLTMMAEDAAVWRRMSPNYRFMRHLAFIVHGGLGDQVAAEPALRFAREVLNVGDHLVAVSDRPELFAHLGMSIYPREEDIPHMLNFRRRYAWPFVTGKCPELHARGPMHAIARAAYHLLDCELPLEYRRPKLHVDPAAARSLGEKLAPRDASRLVLVHPGRAEPADTFPPNVWRAIIDLLIGHGYTVAVVGNRASADCAIVDVDTSGCLDLADRLTSAELIALIAQAPLLLINDAPLVHVAGGFDNWIGLLAPSRHPELVLDVRHGSHLWRALKLERMERYHEFRRPGSPFQPKSTAPLLAALPDAGKLLDFVDRALADAKRR